MGEEEGAVVRQIAKERKRKNTEKGETNTEHKYVLNKTKWPRQVRELILDSDSEILEFWSFNEKNNGEIFCIFCILLSSPFEKYITS